MNKKSPIATFVDWSPGLSINKCDGDHMSKKDSTPRGHPVKIEERHEPSRRKDTKGEKNGPPMPKGKSNDGPGFRTIIDGKKVPHATSSELNEKQKPVSSIRNLPSLLTYPQPEVLPPTDPLILEPSTTTSHLMHKETSKSPRGKYFQSKYCRRLPALDLPSGGACVHKVESFDEENVRSSKTFVDVFLPPLS